MIGITIGKLTFIAFPIQSKVTKISDGNIGALATYRKYALATYTMYIASYGTDLMQRHVYMQA